MMPGTIQSIRPERGFGFLRDTAGAEVLFHRSALTPPSVLPPWKSGCGWSSSRSRVPKGSAPRRSPSRLWRRLRYGRLKSWQPTSTDTPLANPEIT